MKTLSLRTHIFLLVLAAAVVGTLHVAPQILIKRELEREGKPFVPLQITHRGDMVQQYFPRVREAADGHIPPSDLHADERTPTLYPVLPPVIAAPIFWGASDAGTALLIAVFVFSALIFCAFYWLGRVITGSSLWGFFMGFLGTLTPLPGGLPRAFSGVADFLNLVVKHFVPLVATKLDKLFLDRMDDPLLTYPFYIAALTLFLFYIHRPSKPRAVFLGAAVAFLAYVYFHYFVYATIVLGLLGLTALVQKIRKRPRAAEHILYAVGAYTLAVIPFLYNYRAFLRLPGAQDYIGRVAIEIGRFFHWSEPFSVIFDYAVYALLAYAVYRWIYQRTRLAEGGNARRAILYWCFLGAAAIAWNTQLITGFVPHSDHFFKAISPVILIILFDFLYRAVRGVRREAVLGIVSALIALLILKKTINAVAFIHPEARFLEEESKFSYTIDPTIYASWQWLDALPGEPIVLSDSLLTSFYLLNYTSARPYLATGFNTSATNKEIGERFIRANAYFGVPRETVEERLKASPLTDARCFEECGAQRAFNRLKAAQHLFYNYFKTDSAEWRYVSRAFAEILLEDYASADAKALADGLADEPADYVYYGPWEKEFGGVDPGEHDRLKLVYENPSVRIYENR